mmetsp:Transcript_147468/g.209315  ORF Transcript_147468/g.209315 Transcript_147468/m.209315 type:complete len:209 (-) Transcript_147468:1883-2509(-)
MLVMGVPGRGISSTTSPRRWDRVAYTPPVASMGTVMSAKYMGSIRVGPAVSMDAKVTRRAVGRIWPIPRWMASACRVQSNRRSTTPRQTSSHRGPLRVAHWKPEFTDSLISFRYCTARVASISMLGPLPSGAKAHSFLESTSERSKPYFSSKWRACSLASLGWLDTSPSSMASCSSSGMGEALVYKRLCLLGDLDRHCTEDSSWMVSR